MTIPSCVETFEESIALLREAHTQWQCQSPTELAQPPEIHSPLDQE